MSPDRTIIPRKDRKRVLLIAFAYAPGAGSEPGLGWNLANALGDRYDVTVLTDVAWPGTAPDPDPGENLPRVLRMGPAPWPEAFSPHVSQKRWELYYYGWIRTMARRLPALVRQHDIDLVQHLTYGRYWMPSAHDTAGRPFVWGPVGGGESAPDSLIESSPKNVRLPEYFRHFVRALGERDPALHRTAQAADIALATTPESAERMRRLTKAPVVVFPAVSLDEAELDRMGALPPPPDGPVHFLSLGRLLHWKGFDMAIDAFSRIKDPDATYTIIGDGPERDRLQAQVEALGLGHRILFTGRLDRAETLARFSSGHVLVHPSLHDSGGMVCLESMAASRPVICLDKNGPAWLCGESAVVVTATNRAETVDGLTTAMNTLAADPAFRNERGRQGREHVVRTYAVRERANELESIFEGLLNASSQKPHAA